jgi:hypothetical protein
MKSKEQLAEEYAVSQHLNRFAEEWVEKAFLAGFDARDAQLLPRDPDDKWRSC